jgi:hypothetical protein
VRWRKPKPLATLRCGARAEPTPGISLIPILSRADGRSSLRSDHCTLPTGELHHSGPLTSRGARNQLIHPGLCSSEERGRSRAIPLLVWSERSHADRCAASTTATGGPQARITIGRHPTLGSVRSACPVSVSGLGTHTIFSAHPFLLCWLQGYSIALVWVLVLFRLISLLACLLARALC